MGSSDPMGGFGQPPRREVPNEFKNFGSSGGWDDEEDEFPFPKRAGFEPMRRPKPTEFDELEDEEEEFAPPSKGISSRGASAKDIWGSIDDSESEDLEEDSEETEDNLSNSREELEHPKLEEVSESAFTSDLAGGLVEPELVTRSLLLDKYLSVLDGSSLKPDWYREVSKDSLEFKQLETFLRDAQTGGVKGLSEMDWVNVESITERVSVFEIITDRPEKLKGKETLFAKEITELLKDQMKDYFGENVTTTAVGKGSRIAITIFKQTGTSFMLRDLIASSKDFFLDTKNELPVVFGADEYGEPILFDLAKHTGTIIAEQGNPFSLPVSSTK